MDSFPTLDYNGRPISNPSMPLQESFKTSTASISFDSGYEQRRQKGPPLFVFQISYVVLPDSAYRMIRDFFISHTDVSAFNWTHPVSKVTYKVKFDGSSLSGSQFGHDGKHPLWTLKVNLQQVL